jgi:hypothetical protein
MIAIIFLPHYFMRIVSDLFFENKLILHNFVFQTLCGETARRQGGNYTNVPKSESTLTE